MITFEFTSGEGFQRLIGKLENVVPMVQLGKIVQEDIIAETKNRGWKRIGKTIKRRTVNKNTQEIFTAGKDADIAGYLNRGTRGHYIFPNKKQALSWVDGGTRFFSKGHFVRGIKATNFFSIYPSTLRKMKATITESYKQ